MSEYLIERNGYYYYFRRVPKHLAHLDTRTHVKISLKTRDKAVARKRALTHNEAIEDYWRQLIVEPVSPGDDRYRAAVRLARLHGFAYRDIRDVARSSDIGAVVDRLLAEKQLSAEADDPELVRAALLGTVERPRVLLSEAFEIFRSRAADRLAGKTDHEIRKWENPRRAAMLNLVSVVGDIPIVEMKRKHAIDFQTWWISRVEGGRRAQTANRQFRFVRDILGRVVIACQLEDAIDVDSLFAKMHLSTNVVSRQPYEASFVQATILNGDALAGMNAESRALVYMMADTGARVAEIFGLSEDDIFLDAEVPHIHIRKNEKRSLKTAQSDRKIPLVGAALFAAQQFPAGLTRYSSADSASTQINKYFRENGLNPTKDHCLYSLRHTFKDRLRDVQAPEEVIDNLMGHKSRGPKYGRGHILETKLEWLQRIAFDASALVF